MPKRLPENVITSPNATSKDSWICPCGSIYKPQKSIMSPPKASTKAVSNCMFSHCFISDF